MGVQCKQTCAIQGIYLNKKRLLILNSFGFERIVFLKEDVIRIE